MTSYLRHSTRADLTYSDSVWIYACTLIGHGLSMFLGGFIYRRLGLRPTVLLGSWTMSAGVMLTFFTVKHSFLGVVVTYGVVCGLGVGVAYSLPMSCAMKWLPERKGLAGGLVVAGFGGGGFIFNLVQTAFINPSNLSADLTVNNEKYFTQPKVLERVPWVFVLTGGLYAVMQLVGVLLMTEPPQDSSDNSPDPRARARHDPETSPTANRVVNDETSLVSTTHPSIYAEIKANAGVVSNARPAADSGADECINDVNESSADLTPGQVLRSRHFYILWTCFLLNGQGVVFVLTLYKDYGQTFIKDDMFLAVTGAFAALFNCLGRLFWGFIGDRFSYNTAMACLCSISTGVLITFHATSLGGMAVYFIYVCVMFGTLAGNFALFSLAGTAVFGQTHYPINYGFVFTSQAISAPVGAILASQLKTLIGWFGMFGLMAVCSFVSFLLTVIFKVETVRGERV
ncbi:oxalate:formate antiporter-like [Haliotis asinina]|uniref:oxalate:formate antiporter-like n=1 Tax=Haliotis asinina TaxID=109174 RepID=UPI0035321A80